ncbi:dimethylarginine dimethylaminohydrolase family protein [Labrys wisconsinensis]|uniref:Dimethylargininase n=1 Tax=Labrys wisconsinensis TaxID=425677 RepID=A0ABU0J412_9HYPH|nr:dimethylarginine dimethylaminohydrolase [Labrys wisconsinensis]MDQ0469013.1 dimethylargininase [Labrys wisconsinensis]
MAARPVFEFDNAIVRAPASSVVDGLRAVDRGAPTLAGVRAEHEAYVAALEAAGVSVQRLPALDAFADSIFVEDPALVFPEGAIVLRPGAASRFGEAAAIAPVLRSRFATVLELPGPGFADGGDVLVTPCAVMIGLSDRTDRIGADALVARLAELGRTGVVVTTPPGVLHFKSDCALLDEATMLATRRLAQSGVFEGYRVLLTPDGEEGAANALRVNDRVFLGDGFPRTRALLEAEGYRVVPLATSEIARIDAGLSCMSLRWRAA